MKCGHTPEEHAQLIRDRLTSAEQEQADTNALAIIEFRRELEE